MKYSSRILSLLALVSMTVFFTGCDKGEDNKKSAKDKQIEKLVGTWNASEVTYKGAIQADYGDFQLVLSGDNGDDGVEYDANNRPADKKGPWPAGGTLFFGDNVATQFEREGDDLDIDYLLSGTTLTLTFNYAGSGFDGRTDEIEGQWVFTLQK
jgi:hypothetical protein